MQALRCLRKNSTDSYASVNTRTTEVSPPKKRPLWQKILIIVAIVILSLSLLLFLAIWIVLPIVFMETISLQRFFMFMNINQPSNPQFNNPEKYNINGVVNFYITTLDIDNSTLVSIGSWLIISDDEINSYTARLTHDNSTASSILASTTKPIVLYMHGVACNRILPTSTYNVARKYFTIVAMDHRGYGDSGLNVSPSELGIVNDNVQLYKWVRSKTNNQIYVWGHSLGGALATHTVKVLREENIVPMGLILESTFTTMREEIINHIFGKIFKWLAYFNQTILDPLENNGFLFLSTTNILSVDCPIMIMHAEDDSVIPYTLGRRLYEVASTKRDLTNQGNVTYHQFPAVGYDHIGLTGDSKVPQYIEEFMQLCESENKGRG